MDLWHKKWRKGKQIEGTCRSERSAD